MDVGKYLSTCSFWSPEHVTHPLAWVGHIPFAFWIMEAAKPRSLSEYSPLLDVSPWWQRNYSN
jgi:hypothetical protein